MDTAQEQEAGTVQSSQDIPFLADASSQRPFGMHKVQTALFLLPGFPSSLWRQHSLSSLSSGSQGLSYSFPWAQSSLHVSQCEVPLSLHHPLVSLCHE